MNEAIQAVKDVVIYVAFIGGLALLAYGFDKLIAWTSKFDLW